MFTLQLPKLEQGYAGNADCVSPLYQVYHSTTEVRNCYNAGCRSQIHSDVDPSCAQNQMRNVHSVITSMIQIYIRFGKTILSWLSFLLFQFLSRTVIIIPPQFFYCGYSFLDPTGTLIAIVLQPFFPG